MVSSDDAGKTRWSRELPAPYWQLYNEYSFLATAH